MDDDPIRRVLAHIDALMHDLGTRGQALQEVRDLLLRVEPGAGRDDPA